MLLLKRINKSFMRNKVRNLLYCIVVTAIILFGGVLLISGKMVNLLIIVGLLGILEILLLENLYQLVFVKEEKKGK